MRVGPLYADHCHYCHCWPCPGAVTAVKTAKRNPPPWMDRSAPQSDRPLIQTCPRCRGPVLRALVGNPCGLGTRADPKALNPAEELAARIAGRFTYCLRLHPHLPPRLLTRGPEHIAGGNCTHLVLADHHCTRPPPTSTPPPTAEPDRLF